MSAWARVQGTACAGAGRPLDSLLQGLIQAFVHGPQKSYSLKLMMQQSTSLYNTSEIIQGLTSCQRYRATHHVLMLEITDKNVQLKIFAHKKNNKRTPNFMNPHNHIRTTLAYMLLFQIRTRLHQRCHRNLGFENDSLKP